MKTAEYGKENQEAIIFLHGGGLSVWNYKEEAELLKDRFHIVIPVLDGHNGSGRDFTSIEENAKALTEYIDEAFNGQVFLLGGLSLGGQILVEMLSQRNDICKFAVIESALALPMGVTAKLIKPSFSLCFPLIKKRWFAKLQFKSLRIKPMFFEDYYRDSAAVTKENLIAFLAANSAYKLKNSLSGCRAKTLVLVGGREQRLMKKSAEIISEKISGSALEVLPGYFHGDLSINHPDEYVNKLLNFIMAGP